ncbi:MAG: hypothetical protein CVU40_17445 [Chloroflexi bacterium HGW-Chloroflexi-2]|jgi:hypothetical protein|nr:MAG: hypothetical protein CVU40_17445 [Chloroflexi bacterium HGW-Chloroflexi-2]
MLKPTQLSQLIYENQDIWQFNFEEPRNLSSFFRDLNVNFSEDQIIHFWQIGWVRADLVHGNFTSELEGFDILDLLEDEGSLYSDNRILGSTQIQLEEPVKKFVEKMPNVVPYFHPFKYFVFWDIQRIIQFRVHPYQMMIPTRYHYILDQEIKIFYNWIQSESAKTRINYINDITSLAIATEPCFYTEIFNNLKYSPRISAEEQWTNINTYKTHLKEYYLQIGIEPIKEMTRTLCISAEMLEHNKNIHSLLRFMNGRQRLKIKGNLGGSILLKSMSEIIRRMAEWTFDTQLPEEDEMGFGVWMKDAKEIFYGTKRLFDSQDLKPKRQFIRQMELDTEIRIRFYVEGPTEYTAFTHLLDFWQQIEIIDLAGQFIQGKKKGLAFRDNLVTDDRQGVFSIIILDGDRDDNIRIVKKAAENDIFCGSFYISQPDFEYYNFSINELTEIVWDIVDSIDKTEQNYKLLQEALKETTCSEELFKAAKKTIPSICNITKGKEWGEKLAEYAAKRPRKDGDGKERPFIEACNTAIRSINIDYQFNRRDYWVDPETGKLVKRII